MISDTDYGVICDGCKCKLLGQYRVPTRNPKEDKRYCESCESKMKQPDNHRQKDPMMYGIITVHKATKTRCEFDDHSGNGLFVKHNKITGKYTVDSHTMDDTYESLRYMAGRVNDKFHRTTDFFRKSEMDYAESQDWEKIFEDLK